MVDRANSKNSRPSRDRTRENPNYGSEADDSTPGEIPDGEDLEITKLSIKEWSPKTKKAT